MQSKNYNKTKKILLILVKKIKYIKAILDIIKVISDVKIYKNKKRIIEKLINYTTRMGLKV